MDITVIDTCLDTLEQHDEVKAAVAEPSAGAVVLLAWRIDPALLDQAITQGCRGCIDKAVAANELITALERIAAGEIVVSPTVVTACTNDYGLAQRAGPWPGYPDGLSGQEAETISNMIQGLTNDEIAPAMYVSINTVKSYIRTAYRKIGVERRSQTVRWGIEHEMLLPHRWTTPPAAQQHLRALGQPAA